jgi:hypothetical protein
MWEMPDRRVWYFFGPLVVVAIPYFALAPDHSVQRFVEPALYLLCVVMGIVLGALCVRERHSLFHPSITRDDDSFLFWTEVAGCFIFGGIGIWKLFQSLA